MTHAVSHLRRARAAVSRMPAPSDSDQATREVALWSLNQALAALGYEPALAPAPAPAAGTARKRQRGAGVGAAHA